MTDATFTIQRDEFMLALAATEPGLATGRETVTQGACFVFKGGYIHTFNDETYCRYPVDLPIEGAVPAKGLLDATGKFTSDTIKITTCPGEIILTCGRRRAGFRVEDVLMQIDAVDMVPESDMVEATPTFGPSLVRAASCVGKDEERFYRSCVNIRSGSVESCDNHHMIRCYTDTPPIEGDGAFLIRGEAAKGLSSVCVAKYATNNAWLALKTTDGADYYVRRYSDDYPDLSPFIESEAEGQPFRSPEGLAAAIDGANVFARETEEGHIHVSVQKGRTLIRGEGDSGWFEEALLATFDGDPVAFTTNPKIFKQFVERYNVGVLHDGYLKVGNRQDFIYLTSLQMV